MALTFAQGLTIIQARIGDASDSTADTQALNAAQRKVAKARFWPELRKRAFFNTSAAFESSSGVTVAVTNGSTTVTLTGSTWPSNIDEYRIALSPSDPFYDVATRSSDTVILLAEAYQDDTATGQEFTAYKSIYSLASDVVSHEEFWLHEQGRAVPLIYAATSEQVSEFHHYVGGTGTPTHVMPYERGSSGNKQVYLGPETPDDVFRVEYTYKKDTTDGTLTLDDDKWPLVLELATAIRYEIEHPQRAARAMKNYRRMLDEDWAMEGDGELQEVRSGDTRWRYTSSDWYLENLPGYGRVQDPT